MDDRTRKKKKEKEEEQEKKRTERKQQTNRQKSHNQWIKMKSKKVTYSKLLVNNI